MSRTGEYPNLEVGEVECVSMAEYGNSFLGEKGDIARRVGGYLVCRVLMTRRREVKTDGFGEQRVGWSGEGLYSSISQPRGG
jgi:hypothetical protein